MLSKMKQFIIWLIVLVGMLNSSSLMAQLSLPFNKNSNENISNKNKIFFIGLKGGFNSSLFLTSDLIYNQQEATKLQNNYKIGFLTSVFFQYNFKSFYIQPEIGYSIDNGELLFNLPAMTNDKEKYELYAKGKINSTIHSLEVPFYFGHHIINNSPYKLSIFVGPKVKFCINKKTKTDIDINNIDLLQEKIYPIQLNATVGVSVNISNILFDFHYDIGLHNISKNITPMNAIDFDHSKLQLMTFKRKYNVLSFSIGIYL